MKLHPAEYPRIGVLMGGVSSERPISLKSGTAVYDALVKAGYRAAAIDITSADPGIVKDRLQQENIGIAFITLHGRFGEDGAIQSILEDLGIPYTGPGVEASRRAFHKNATQAILKDAGVRIPEFELVHSPEAALQAAERLGWPAVIKPASEGSSIGVSIVREKEDFAVAAAEAFRYGSDVMVESYIAGREMTVAILDQTPLPVVEIRSSHNFFDFTAKYQEGETQYFVPAPLSMETAQNVQSAALAAYRAVGCCGLSRVDVILKDDNPYVIEINTIPGFTRTSLFPKAAKEAGMDFTQLCSRLIEIAYGAKKEV